MPTVRVTDSNDETIHHVTIIDPTSAKRALYDLMDRRADSLDASARRSGDRRPSRERGSRPNPARLG